jgi:GT2 family glycosyltransferase
VILTSDIGNEGINLVDSINGYVANTTKEFVDRLCKIYTLSDSEIRKVGQLGKETINKLVSEQSALTTLKNTLQDKHIVISIVAYKNSDKLHKCLESIIQKSGYSNYTIEIVDNSSEQKNQKIVKHIQKKYPKIDIVYTKNTINEYFIIPNNKLMRKYPESDILLVNDDIEIITENFLSILYSSAYSSYDICAVGGKTIFPNGTIAEAGAELYQNGYGKNIGRGRNPKDMEYNIPKFVGYCSGCLLYMRRDAIQILGEFDEDLEKMYYEDSEWQYRGHTKGLKTLYQPLCEAIHNEGSSAGTDVSVGAKKYQEINRLRFAKKYRNYNVSSYNS